MHGIWSLPTYPVRAFVKHVFVFFAIILALIPAVYAEDDKWIDGIRFRLGLFRDPTVIYMPWKIESRNSPFFNGKPPLAPGEGKIAYDKNESDLFPIAIELPETLMTSWSFRGGLLEFEFPKELKDLSPSGDDSFRTSLYNDFFNDSDKAFADANPDWAMSSDVTSSRIFLGYTWGFFIPIGENHRFLKFGTGLGVYYIDLSLKLNLCSQYIMTNYDTDSPQGECVGKTEIDSYSGKKSGVASAGQMTFWERRTKDSIWRFLQISSGAALGSNDKGYIRVKLKNHRSLALFIGSETWEIITYTYRF